MTTAVNQRSLLNMTDIDAGKNLASSGAKFRIQISIHKKMVIKTGVKYRAKVSTSCQEIGMQQMNMTFEMYDDDYP